MSRIGRPRKERKPEPDKYTMEEREHINAIDALIPQAEAEATAKVNGNGIKVETRQASFGPYQHSYWADYFSKAMNRLTIKAGLRVKL